MNKFIFALCLLSFPIQSMAQERNAFIDPTTGVLKAVGYVKVNGPGEIKVPVAEDFSLKPGEWRWDGKTWAAMPTFSDAATADLNDLAFAIDNAVSSPLVPAEVKDVLLKLKKYLGSK
ncbi:MAG: hypothetical protein ACREP3_10910 [Candidatus Binatia bacterium]